MKPLKLFTIFLLILIPLITTLSDAEESIRQRMEAWNAGYKADISGDTIYHQDLLDELYLGNNYQPFWLEKRHLNESAVELLHIISRIDEEGLEVNDYHADLLSDLLFLKEEPVPVEADILLSDAFLLLTQHLLLGKIDPESLIPDWRTNRKDIDKRIIWHRFAAGESIDTIIDSLRPNQEGYKRLKSALAYLIAHRADSWQKLALSPSIKPMTIDSRIPSVREKLEWWHDFNQGGSAATTESPGIQINEENIDHNSSELYDLNLKQAVENFQYLHGLDADGVIGAATLRALNRSPEELIGDVRVNLERWRWLDKDFGRQFIVVNIADFNLRVYDNNEVVLQKPVVVGKSYRKTPVFSGQIKYIVFNPTWTVPHKIAIVDKLPEIKKDPIYLNRMGFSIYQAGSSNLVDPSKVDWEKTDKTSFPYRMVQNPGPLNALGQVKFMFPNPFNVYLHDTPDRELFAKPERAFSSGCIRVYDPLDLALVLLSPQGWDQDRIDTIIRSGNTTAVYLQKPIPIHIEYWTAWVDREGALNFRNDIYNRDSAVLKALMYRQ